MTVRARVALHRSRRQEQGLSVSGREVRNSLMHLQLLGEDDLRMFLAQPCSIPVEWRGLNVFFWQRVRLNAAGAPFVPFLYYKDWEEGDVWGYTYRWLDGVWGPDSPAAVYVLDDN